VIRGGFFILSNLKILDIKREHRLPACAKQARCLFSRVKGRAAG
jgi:hypothetical protein